MKYFCLSEKIGDVCFVDKSSKINRLINYILDEHLIDICRSFFWKSIKKYLHDRIRYSSM